MEQRNMYVAEIVVTLVTHCMYKLFTFPKYKVTRLLEIHNFNQI